MKIGFTNCFALAKKRIYLVEHRSCAQFAPGCKFATKCIFGHVNGVVRICTLLLLTRWCKFICTRVQIVHMNANCIIYKHSYWRFR